MFWIPVWRSIEPGWKPRNFLAASIFLGLVALAFGVQFILVGDLRIFFSSMDKPTMFIAYRSHSPYFASLGIWMGLLCTVFTVQSFTSWRFTWREKFWKPLIIVAVFANFLFPFLFNGEMEGRLDMAGYKFCTPLEPGHRMANVILYSRSDDACARYRKKYCARLQKIEFGCEYKKGFIEDS